MVVAKLYDQLERLWTLSEMAQLSDVLVLHLRVDDTLLPDLRLGRIRQMFLLDDLLDVELEPISRFINFFLPSRIGF